MATTIKELRALIEGRNARIEELRVRVFKLENKCSDCYRTRRKLRLENEKLLEAVNRPVSGDEVLKACETYNEWFAVPSDQAWGSALHATLEAHMAALREEVGK